MNFFCRLFGHTWVPGAENLKIRWNADKDGLQLWPTVEGTPKFFEECARCKERRPPPPLRTELAAGAKLDEV